MAMNVLSVADIESMWIKIYRYFIRYTVKIESLERFCNFVEEKYQHIFLFNNVLRLSMLPAVKRIWEMYYPLKSFFWSQDKCPTLLRQLFKSPVTKLWLLFSVASLELFTSTIKQIGGKKYRQLRVRRN